MRLISLIGFILASYIQKGQCPGLNILINKLLLFISVSAFSSLCVYYGVTHLIALAGMLTYDFLILTFNGLVNFPMINWSMLPADSSSANGNSSGNSSGSTGSKLS
jgi:hypothetical protein